MNNDLVQTPQDVELSRGGHLKLESPPFVYMGRGRMGMGYGLYIVQCNAKRAFAGERKAYRVSEEDPSQISSVPDTSLNVLPMQLGGVGPENSGRIYREMDGGRSVGFEVVYVCCRYSMPGVL